MFLRIEVLFFPVFYSFNIDCLVKSIFQIQEFSMSTGVNLATRPLYDGTVIFEEGIFGKLFY